MVKQILWVLIGAAITALLAWLCFTWDGSRIIFHIGEGVHLIRAWKVLLPLFFVTLFVIFLIKEFRDDFQNFLPNIFLITAGLLSILTFSELKGDLILANAEGVWVAYPPMSVSKDIPQEKPIMDPAIEVWLLILTVFEVFIAFFLLVVGFKWGRGSRDPE